MKINFFLKKVVARRNSILNIYLNIILYIEMNNSFEIKIYKRETGEINPFRFNLNLINDTHKNIQQNHYFYLDK